MAETHSAERYEVDPADIERELSRVWREAAHADAQAESGEQSARVRATLSNFVILTEEGSAGQDQSVDELITALCISHPSRFFILRKHPTSSESGNTANAPGVRTFVSSRCVLARSGAHVCSEEVHVSFHREQSQSIPNLLLSLFAADVPVVVMIQGMEKFGGDPVLDRLFSSVLEHAQFLMFDSEQFDRFEQTANLLLHRLAWEGQPGVWFPNSSGTKIYDLNWYRTSQWRSLIAEQFDAVRLREMVPSISSIEISVASSVTGPFTPSAESYSLAGWFATALRWDVDGIISSDGIIRFDCKSTDGTPREVRFIPQQDPAAVGSSDGRVLSLAVKMGSDHSFVLRVARDYEAERAVITTENHIPLSKKKSSTPETSASSVVFRRDRLEELVIRPLYVGSREDQFVQSFAQSIKFAEKLLEFRSTPNTVS